MREGSDINTGGDGILVKHNVVGESCVVCESDGLPSRHGQAARDESELATVSAHLNVGSVGAESNSKSGNRDTGGLGNLLEAGESSPGGDHAGSGRGSGLGRGSEPSHGGDAPGGGKSGSHGYEQRGDEQAAKVLLLYNLPSACFFYQPHSQEPRMQSGFLVDNFQEPRVRWVFRSGGIAEPVCIVSGGTLRLLKYPLS